MFASASIAPPLGSHQVMLLLLQLAVLLLLAVVLGRLAVRLGMPVIVGELTAGLLLGPSVLGQVAPGLAGWLLPPEAGQAHLLDAVGQLGVLLLVGVAGAQLDVRLLQRRRGTVTRISLTGLVVPLGLGMGLAFLLPGALLPPGTDRTVFALFIGVAMCVCAIPVIAKTLSDMNLLHRDVGQLTLAAAVVDDAVGWFLLSIVSAMATVGVYAGQVTLSVLYLAGFLLLTILAGRPAVAWVMRIADRTGEPGLTTALAVVIVLLGAAGTHAMGMEPIFGAFVAGALLGSPGVTELRHLAGLRLVVAAVLAPIFLASAGLRMDLTAFRDPQILLAGVAVVLVAVAGKMIGAYLGGRLSRLSHWEGLALGAGMNARGAVEVVVATIGLRIGVLNTASYTILLLVAIMTSLMAPPLLRVAMSRVEGNAEERIRKAEHDAWSVPTSGHS